MKLKGKEKDNLVLYNLDRVETMTQEYMEEKGEFCVFHGYDDIIHVLDFIKKEMERNYNAKAELKCSECSEVFLGWKAYERLISHEVEKHPEKGQAEALMVMGCVSVAMCGLQIQNAQWLYDKSGSLNAKEVLRLATKGRDIPVELMRKYREDHNDYMDSVDPKRKWHKPTGTSYLDKVSGNIVGRNTIVKETAKAVFGVLKGKLKQPIRR